MLERFSRSLSLRLLAIFLLLGGLFVYGTLVAIRWVYNSEDIRGLISGHLSLHVHYVRDDIGSPPRIDRALDITRRVPVDIRILGPGIDWASDPRFPRLSELTFGPSPAFSDDPGAWVDELRGIEFAVMGDHNFLRMTAGEQDEFDIVVVSPRIADVRSGHDLTLLIVAMGLSFLLIGYFAVSWLFQPIRAIREGAAQIGRGHFDYRIEKIRHDQLGDLAADISQLAADVQSMLDAKRALLLGISHELRTPLSRLNLSLELLEDAEGREDLKAEIIEMEKIIDTLLEAERLNTRHAALVREESDVRQLVEQMIDDYFDRDRHRIKLVDESQGAKARIDAARVALMLKNLLSNALRYSADAEEPVEVRLSTTGDELVFTVRDHGPGIPAEQAERLGEPFYRGDPSRARHTGGTGLGLYLAKLVALAHGGTLELTHRDEPGACFEVSLPLRQSV
jgi:signal transduction histidine kinase